MSIGLNFRIARHSVGKVTDIPNTSGGSRFKASADLASQAKKWA